MNTHRINRQKRGKRAALIVGTILFALASTAGPEAARGQDQATPQSVHRFPPLNLFRRQAISPNQGRGLNQSPSQPRPLQVVDRATAQRLAAEQRAADAPAQSTRNQATNAQNAEYLNLQDDPGHNVRAASYQTPAARTYRTPPVNPYPYDPYPSQPTYDDYAPGYDPADNAWMAPPGAPLNGAPFNGVPLNGTPLPGADPRQSVPSVQFGDSYHDSLPPYPGESIDVGQGPPLYAAPPGPQSGLPQGYTNGQGYLQQGSPFHGQYLSPGSPTATERALELQTENLKLRESLTRSQLELSNRIEEIAQLNLNSRQKDEELTRAQARIDELTRQVTRLSGELKQAIQERNEIERKANEQLMNIESVLDSVLMEALTDRKGG